ncbi:MAG TPA: nicotinate phosphoribosyltransferase [Actinobacteria bacterium]|nr:nicotinate phosphoribosyltransferase [Actinomycetota bacterium]
MSQALVTDLYELNMAASYLRRGMTGLATFSLFVRDLPRGRGFLVAGGLEDCLAYLETFAFAEEDLRWLSAAGFAGDSIGAFASLRFTGDVHAIPEGRVVLPNEPLLEVTAPIAQAQLVETYLLNQVTFQTAIATKAARCRLAAGGDIDLVDFALRRTHGVDAGMAVARLSAIAGFTATSNVEAARRFGLQAAGTMAHSYIEAFADEASAFRAFATDLPGRTTFLVDTYDTLAGVEAAIGVIRELGLTRSLAVRLDSGDLAALARETRRLLDAAGLPQVRIFVSGGLDELDLERMRLEGVPVDAAGVGTRLGVSADAPSLDSAYKLVAYDGRPVLKLSEGKATLPGPKQVWRRMPVTEDLLARRDEPGSAGYEPLLLPVMRAGQRTGPPDTVAAARARLERDLAGLPAHARDLREPVPPQVRVSGSLRDLAATLTDDLRHRGKTERSMPGGTGSGRLT